MKYCYETRMAVRDYECDIEGIVNNANYLHYCEHTRHLFLKECGLSFAEMHEKGVDAVVARMSLQYKVPLRPDDEFVSRLGLRNTTGRLPTISTHERAGSILHDGADPHDGLQPTNGGAALP